MQLGHMATTAERVASQGRGLPLDVRPYDNRRSQVELA